MARPVDIKLKGYRKCLICENKFYIYLSNRKKYCSLKCSGINQQKRTYKQCLICSVEFYVRPHTIKKGFGKYCSIDCHGKAQRTGEDRNCLVCEKSFYAVPRQVKENEGKYCSLKCFYKVNMGKNNSAWKGGVTPLHKRIRESFEYEHWRIKVFERDLYTCQMCGQTGGYLEADHIKPFSLYPELRFELSNGRTLCKSCHKLTDTYGQNIKNYKFINI